MKKTKCNCPKNNKIFCSTCSHVKMVILLKKGNSHLKYQSLNSKKYYPIWYSHLSKNSKSTNKIVSAMFKRFKKSKYSTVTNKLMFYNNATKNFITSITIVS